jgi:hypothetical protein
MYMVNIYEHARQTELDIMMNTITYIIAAVTIIFIYLLWSCN